MIDDRGEKGTLFESATKEYGTCCGALASGQQLLEYFRHQAFASADYPVEAQLGAAANPGLLFARVDRNRYASDYGAAVGAA